MGEYLTPEEEAAILRRLDKSKTVDYESPASVTRAVNKGIIHPRKHTTALQDQYLARNTTKSTKGQKWRIAIQYNGRINE